MKALSPSARSRYQFVHATSNLSNCSKPSYCAMPILKKHAAMLILIAALLASCSRSQLTTASVNQQELTNLIAQLSSTRPAPYTNLSYNLPREIEFQAMFGRYSTPAVETAIEKLKALGPPIYPELIKHLGDKRYSYSQVSAAWLNHTVRDALIVVLSDEHFMHSGYKWRTVPSGDGSYLSFDDYLGARGAERWAEWASKKTRLEIQQDFIEWCVAEEEKRGFTDEKQREQILGSYQSARDRMIKEYSAKRYSDPR